MTRHEELSAAVRQRAQQARNYGPIQPYHGHGTITGPCGDTMEFWVQVSEGRIVNIGFTTTGCDSSRAAGSMATELARGKSLQTAARIEQADILGALGGLPEESEHCALLASNTLKAAIRDAAGRRSADGPACQSGACQGQATTERDAEEERQQRILHEKMRQIGYKLVVMSGKGGVGKSTVAANLAVALAQAGKSVGLLDVDIHGPSIPRLMGLEGSTLVQRGSDILPIEVGYLLKVMSIGFLLSDGDAAVIWRGPMKHGVIRQFLKDVDWGTLDYLIIDAPPGTGDEPLSVAQLVTQPAGALLVTTPQALAVDDVRRSRTFCRQVSLPVVGIIENMSGMLCPHCGERIDPFKTGGGEALADEMNVPFLGRIPIDTEVVRACDAGAPFVKDSPHTSASKAFEDIVDSILTTSGDERASPRHREEHLSHGPV
jgi:Mrp family chromosome partitioning ATPase